MVYSKGAVHFINSKSKQHSLNLSDYGRKRLLNLCARVFCVRLELEKEKTLRMRNILH